VAGSSADWSGTELTTTRSSTTEKPLQDYSNGERFAAGDDPSAGMPTQWREVRVRRTHRCRGRSSQLLASSVEKRRFRLSSR
jgi:hypothetical protein